MSTAGEQEQQITTRPVVESLSGISGKRKRSRSSDSETEENILLVKKKTFANGETEDDVATTETTKELGVGEKVVILDAGAQYGKVPVLQTCRICCSVYMSMRAVLHNHSSWEFF